MKQEYHDECGVCKIPAFERNHYFYGKLMTPCCFVPTTRGVIAKARPTGDRPPSPPLLGVATMRASRPEARWSRA